MIKSTSMSEFAIKSFHVSPLRAELIQPFRIASGEHASLENILFSIELKNGVKGIGEAAIASHITGETFEQTLKNMKLAGGSIIRKNVCDYMRISAHLNEMLPRNKCAVAAIETAVADAFTRSLNIPLWKLFGHKALPITTDVTIVIADFDETKESIVRFGKMGFKKFKIKIGKDHTLDIERVRLVKKLYPAAGIYLDANQGFTPRTMLAFIKTLAKYKIIPELIEQPVPKDDIEGLKKITASIKIPVCADESASSIADCVRLIKIKAVTAINIKLAKFGLFEAREAAMLAKKFGIKLMMGSMVESHIAAMSAAHLAAGLGVFDYIDLDTPFFLKKSDIKNPYLNSRGTYKLSTTVPGLGVTI